MSKRQPWCRLYSETLFDRKISRVARRVGMPKFAVLGVWSGLLCMANDSPERGKLLMGEGIPLEVEEIADALQMDNDEELTSLLDAFEKLDMVAWENDTLVLCHWSERQFESDSSAKRVAKHRAKKQAEGKQAPEKQQAPPSRQRKPGPRPRQTKWTPESEQAAEKETKKRCENAGEEQPGNVTGEEPCNVTATLHDQSVKRYGNAPDTDSDTDTDTDITRARVGARAPAPRDVKGEDACNVTATLHGQSVQRRGNGPDTDSDSESYTDSDPRGRVGARAPAPRQVASYTRPLKEQASPGTPMEQGATVTVTVEGGTLREPRGDSDVTSHGNGDVTSQERHGDAPDTDSDSDTDTDITRARVGAGAPAPRVRTRTWEPPPPAIEPITEDDLAQLREAFGASLVESVLAQGEYVDRHELVIAATQACRANGGVTT